MSKLRSHKFLILLIFQLIFILIYPLVETTFWEWALHVALAFVYLLISFLSSRNRYSHRILWSFLLIISGIFVVDYINYFTDISLPLSSNIFWWIYQGVLAIYFTYITFYLSYHMLTDDEPELDILAGAASIYLTIAFVWTFFYMTLNHASQDAFKLAESKESLGYMDWLFYSIKTLVSSDSPNILASSSYAQCFTILESIIGSLYIAIITARIVGVDFNNPREILKR